MTRWILVVVIGVVGCASEDVPCRTLDSGERVPDCSEACRNMTPPDDVSLCVPYCRGGTCASGGWSSDETISCGDDGAVCSDGQPVVCGFPLADEC